ncbi:P-loop containing nucleoside triphosphate hydrolase protein [Panaeolus papilionaceus]|nr:P-loop containing nucleoside triphosphate hydrolase protein [Panaeolus papilionaceus]
MSTFVHSRVPDPSTEKNDVIGSAEISVQTGGVVPKTLDLDPTNAFVAVLDDINKDDDIIVAVMGVTGAGKTSFIKAIAGDKVQGVGHNLDAGTNTVNCFKIPIPQTESHLILVDTPGFDDPNRTDGDILTVIAEWLKASYKEGKTLSGIIYLHRITDIRFDSGSAKSLTLFKHICGGDVFDKVCFTTTKWNDVQPEKKIDYERKEDDLRKDHWGVYIAKGSITSRFDSTTEEMARDTAKKTVQKLVEDTTRKMIITLQKQLVDQKLPLYKTDAGKYAFTFEQTLNAQLFQLRNILA